MTSLRRKQIKWEKWHRRNPAKSERRQQMIIRKHMAKWAAASNNIYGNPVPLANIGRTSEFVEPEVRVTIFTKIKVLDP